jgi:dGTPase
MIYGLATHSSLESQVAAIADDIAYNTHDIDDGLRSGLITLEMLEELPLISRLLAEVRDRHPGLEEPRLIHEVMRRQITRMVEDVIGVAQAHIQDIKPQSADDVRHAGRTMAHFSEEFVTGRPAHQGLPLSPSLPPSRCDAGAGIGHPDRA